MSTRPTTDPAIALARQAMRARRIDQLQRETDRLDALVAWLDRRAATVTVQRDHDRITPAVAARALDGLRRKRADTVAAIDTRLAELARLRAAAR